MDGFTYIDIFATKGIEYLLVIAFLLCLTLFWSLLSRRAKTAAQNVGKLIPAVREWFRLPRDIYYHLGHSWALPEAGNVVRVGMDDFAQKLVGPIREIRVPGLGSVLNQGNRGWTLAVDSKKIDMLSPVNGKVIAINQDVVTAPGNIHKDPYQSWLLKIETPHFSADKKQLLSGTLAEHWMEAIKDQLLSKMNRDLGLLYQDGGVIVDGVAKNLDENRWEDIVKEFFLTGED
jgi:glycine cleavage system H protein